MKTWILGLVGACSVALLGTGAEAWQDAIHGIINSPADLARAVAVDTAGNVVAAGRLQATDTTTAFTVIKFDGATGAERWRQVITGTVSPGNNGAQAVAVDAAGDVVAAGRLQITGTTTAFTVIKCDGATGGKDR